MNMPYLPNLQKQPKFNPLFWLLVIATIFILIGIVRAEEIDLSIIAKIESNSNPMAISYKGAKYGRGIYQISEICLKDYNMANNAEISPVELFSPKVNRDVAFWYFNLALPLYLRNKGIPVTPVNLLIAYNFGIGNLSKYLQGKVELPKETRNYLIKYKKFARSK